jgi:hypothetical protein
MNCFMLPQQLVSYCTAGGFHETRIFRSAGASGAQELG